MELVLGIKDKVDIAAYDILVLVKKNIKILLKDPAAMAYILYKWDRLAHSGRHIDDSDMYTLNKHLFKSKEDFWNYYDTIEIEGLGTCEDNPKYALELVLKAVSGKNEDIVYDAWTYSVSNEGYYKETWENFYSDANVVKTEKLKDSYQQLAKSLKDRYPSLFPNDFSIRDHIFCVIGTGLTIYKGNIINKNSKDIYHGAFSRKDSLPIEVSDKFFEIINRPECKYSIENAKKDTLSNTDELDTVELYSVVSSLSRDKHVEKEEERKELKKISTTEEYIDYIMKLIELLKIVDTNQFIINRIIGNLAYLREVCLKDRSGYNLVVNNEGALDSFRAKAKIYGKIYNIPEDELYPQEFKEENEFLFKQREVTEHYPCSIEYSPLFQYKKLNSTYKEALIITANEILLEDKQTTEVKEKCKKLLMYFENK